ncbi:hypothetical protein EVAR_35805_1 [Eumeta japonica]|uniref:Uncharacterized protein n=1 Tax=Eumeta variegata TaxID=151549 RepID=A0A4C1WR69_EUMVA|nr:hypothetical protein EVAR_35805_1 [Eumeta japonica]
MYRDATAPENLTRATRVGAQRLPIPRRFLQGIVHRTSHAPSAPPRVWVSAPLYQRGQTRECALALFNSFSLLEGKKVHPSQLYFAATCEAYATINKSEHRNVVHHFAHTPQEFVATVKKSEVPLTRRGEEGAGVGPLTGRAKRDAGTREGGRTRCTALLYASSVASRSCQKSPEMYK